MTNVPKEQLEALINQGLSYTGIGRALNVTRQRAQQLCKVHGLTTVTRQKRRERKSQIKDLFDRGVTPDEIVTTLGLNSRQCVYVVTHQPRPSVSIDMTVVRRLLKDETLTWQDIADRIGVTAPALKWRVLRAGIRKQRASKKGYRRKAK
jgi:hypothetical protein